MVTYTITDGTTTYNIAELGGVKNGESLDVYTVLSNGKFNNNTNVIIYYDSTPIFYGIVKKIVEQSQTAMYELTCYERSVELKGMQYLSGANPIFTKTSISVTDLVTDILSGSGWTNGSTDATTITSFSCYYVNKLQALQKVIREMRGLYIWFNSSTKTVYYGAMGTDRSATPISYIEKRLKSSTEARNITKVIVIGKDESIIGTAGTGTNVATYQVTDITTSTEATSMATTILADLGNEYSTYEVTIDPSQYIYGARDKVTVDSSIYYVKEVDHTLNEIKLTIDSGVVSVIDSLGSRITEISGSFPEGTDAQWSGGNSNVAANGASYTQFVFDVKDISMITDANIDATISQFDKNTDVGVTTSYLSDISQTDGSDTTIGNIEFAAGTNYIPSSDGYAAPTMSTGYQFGLAVLTGDLSVMLSASYTQAVVYIYLEYKIGSGAWTSSGSTHQMRINKSADTELTIYPVSMMALIPGQADSSQLYLRWILTTNAAADLRTVTGFRYSIQRVTRHTHSVTTTYDKTAASNTPATTVLVHINSGTDVTLTPGTKIPLSGTIGTLITGKNTIYIKTPSSVDNQCSVNPTITYQTLGKS